MNFEALIEQKIVDLIKAEQYIINNPLIQVFRFNKIREPEKINYPFVAVQVEPRINISGPLWTCNFHIDVLTPHSYDGDGSILDELTGIAGDIVDVIKADPSLVDDT